MSVEDLPEHLRTEIARLCRASKQRSAEFSRQRPTRWSPGTVVDPRDPGKNCFTDNTAWEYIAERLLAGEPVEVITLDLPPGKKGYVLKIEVEEKLKIYIKLQLFPPGIIGRSFHYSDY